MIKKLWNEESGQGMTEYGLILALVSVVAIVALIFLGDQIFAVFDSVANSLTLP
ncbi:MAG: Flp family type IVb pilin [Clostridia bacterium]|jgi:pilus assembly protein Flp/PilA|nr:Flp family type IVb pilin [Clostridia bacterium]